MAESSPLINRNPILQAYYASFESRVDYQLFLGGTRHFGYYPTNSSWQRWWPFPIDKALRRMEDKLFEALELPSGSMVLDAGCGYGYVAMHMARRGLDITDINIVDRHLARARQNVRDKALNDAIQIQKADYHHLECFPEGSFDGAYARHWFTQQT